MLIFNLFKQDPVSDRSNAMKMKQLGQQLLSFLCPITLSIDVITYSITVQVLLLNNVFGHLH